MRRKKNGMSLAGGSRIPLGGIVGYGSIGMLTLLFLMMLLPITSDSSFAACTPDSSTEECMAMPISTEVGIKTNTVISLALDNQVQMEVVPKSNGATSYASTKLAVSTNSNDGYAIYLQTGSETGNLTGVTTNLGGEISNTAKDKVTLDNLENNAYGYALSKTAVNESTTYSHVPTTSTVVESTANSVTASGEYAYGDTYYLAFGTKIGTDLPAGQYAGTVTVSAVANPTTLRSMFDLTYMQDMTGDICTNTREGYTKQLIDTRDGKSYWVAKLKDGNCWMTQNLALDITEAGLSASDTDIEEDWNQNSEYPPTETNSVKFSGSNLHANVTKANSWNLGKVVLAIPAANRGCNGGKSATSADKLGEVCASVGFIDVSGDDWKNTYIVAEGSMTPEGGTAYAGPIAVDMTAKTYDAHYLIGNYYSYNAATAGTGVTTSIETTPEVAPGSICPNGWKLPLAGLNFASEKDSFAYLFEQYGYTGTSLREDYYIAPFYIVRSGGVYSPTGYLSYAGHQARLWSGVSTIVNGVNVFAFFLSSASTFGQASDTTSLGFPVRCIAR